MRRMINPPLHYLLITAVLLGSSAMCFSAGVAHHYQFTDRPILVP